MFDQGKYEEAGKLTEGHLISGVSDIYASLIMLMELALKEGRIEDAEYIVKRYEETWRLQAYRTSAACDTEDI